MSHFVGIDLHRNRSHLVAVDEAGERVWSRRVRNDPGRVLDALAELDDPRVAVEATYGWEWLVELLEDHDISHELSHPKATKAIASARVKTDAVDAATLAQLLRVGMLPTAYIASREVRDLRGVIRHRVGLTQLRTSLKNRVHALIASHGGTLAHTDLFGVGGRKELDQIPVRAAARQRIESYLRLIDHLTVEINTARAQIEQAAQHDPHVGVLTQIPGVGVFTAMVITTEVADHTRFPSAKHITSWAGLAPVVRNSDRTTRIGHISKQGCVHLRWALVQAAHTAVRKPGPLHDTYHRIAPRRGKNIATIAVARRILELAYFGLRDNEIRCLTHTHNAA
jgi:transposase